jgi:TPR repeat protein
MDATTHIQALRPDGQGPGKAAFFVPLASDMFGNARVFKKTSYVADLKPARRDVANNESNLRITYLAATGADQGAPDVNLRDKNLAAGKTRSKLRATDHRSGAHGKVAEQGGPAVDGAVPHPAGRTRNGVMRIFERTIFVAFVLGAASAAVPAWAFDGAPVGADSTIPVVTALPGAAPSLKKVGQPDTSLTALQYAAEGGHPIAQWKLGRMYADGNGVAQNDLRAFEYFSRIANAHAEDSPSAPQATVVANAFVALGRYYLEGIPNSKVKADTERAREMFSYAASYFGNADAQYDLARLYLKGIGAPRDTKYGARWLGLAAQKGQHQAQALLGQMLFNGEQLPRQMARGLMWLTLARDNAAPDEVWIKESYNRAISKASEDDRAMALQMLEHWVQGKRD